MIENNINSLGFLRIAAASPKLKVGDCFYNVNEIKSVIFKSVQENVQLLCFPELSITGKSCGDLFLQTVLQKQAWLSLIELETYVKALPGIIVVVGLPLVYENCLINVAAVLGEQGIIGVVPQKGNGNTNAVFDMRWFSQSILCDSSTLNINERSIPLVSNGVFETDFANFVIAIDDDVEHIALDKKVDVVLNPRAMGEIFDSYSCLKSFAVNFSSQNEVAYIVASSGCGESSTDAVYPGSCLVAENGDILKESKRFSCENELIFTEVNIESLRNRRLRKQTFRYCNSTDHNKIKCEVKISEVTSLSRSFNAHPFIPDDDSMDDAYYNAFMLQTMGLMKRLQHTGVKKVTIGISGGLDSTLALLVAINAFDIMGLPRENIIGITMPGFGTTSKTYDNALSLMKGLRISMKEISIVPSVQQHFIDIEHDPSVHDVTYENSQARERTQILMDYANKIGGMVLGTGNMSELALGWATYNGDHMSMYGVNAGIPKTMVASLTRWIAENYTENPVYAIIISIIDTPFSPELLPVDKKGEIAQKTEHFVGPYELHDFFLYRALYYGDTPIRIAFMAEQAFENVYDASEIKKWLRVFYTRFFAQQFKRSCMPDGPKVCAVSLSPRGSWVMPSDAMNTIWLRELEKI